MIIGPLLTWTFIGILREKRENTGGYDTHRNRIEIGKRGLSFDEHSLRYECRINKLERIIMKVRC